MNEPGGRPRILPKGWGAATVIPFLFLSCVSTPPPDQSAVTLVARMAENPALVGLKGRVNNDGSVTDTLSSDVPPFGVSNSHRTVWMFVQMDEESELRRIGSPAIPAVVQALRDVNGLRDFRARLAILLGRLGDTSAAPALLSIALAEPDPFIRECCFTGLGLLRALDMSSQLQVILQAHPDHKNVITWVMAMAGSQAAVAECVKGAEVILAREELEDIMNDLPLPKLLPSGNAEHLCVRAKETAEARSLVLDLWRLAHFRQTKVVEVLIEALRYHNSHVQHVAQRLLEASIEHPLATKRWHCYDLHTLEVYEEWKIWWNENQSFLRWDESMQKFQLSRRSK